MKKTPGQLQLEYREKVNELRSLQINRKFLTQGELAKEIGVSETTVGSWERDVSKPTTKYLKKLIELYLSEGAFPEGKEEEAAKELWEMIGRNELFNEEWFRGLPKSSFRPFTGDEQQILKRALARNPRDVSLMEAIESVGLVDIENRDDDQKSLPPRQFYKMAKHEIVITGITAHTTIVKHDDEIIEALEASKGVCILILSPDPKLVEEMEEREHLKIITEIRSVIDSIQLHKLDQFHNFAIKFMQKIPSFTGVMIDGDVNHKGKTPQDYEGQIRVQPASVYGTQHRGVILQFKKKIDLPKGAFDYYAEDMRKQWQKGVSLESLPRDIDEQK